MFIKVLFGILIFGSISLFVSTRVNAFSPSSQPSIDWLVGVAKEIKNAYLVADVNTAVAVGASDAVAGIVGGLASRGAAAVLGDIKTDSLQTKLQTTSAFFGTRGLVRGLALVLGVPRPVAILSSAIFAAIVAEEAKAAGREADNSMKDLKDKETLDGPEIIGDVSKWLIYDLLLNYCSDSLHPGVMLETGLSLGCGGVAACSSLFLAEILVSLQYQQYKKCTKKWNRRPDHMHRHTSPQAKEVPRKAPEPPSTRSIQPYWQATLEGSVLFASYDILGRLLGSVNPAGSSIRFAFYDWLDSLAPSL